MRPVSWRSAAVALVALVSLTVPALGASEGVTLLTSYIEKQLDPGQSLNVTIDVRNEGQKEQIFYPGVRDIEGMDEEGHPVFAPEGQEMSEGQLSSWISFSYHALRLAPGQTAPFNVFIRVPENAPHGGHFAVVMFSTEPPEVVGENSAVSVAYAAGTIVALRVGQDATDEAVLREFRTDEGVIGAPPVKFLTRIENTGNALTRPYGTIEVSNMFGRFVSSASFSPTAGAILPGSIRKYTTAWDGEGFLLGRYTADISITYGLDEKKTLVGTASFWILPAKPLLYALGGFVVVFLAVLMWVRSYVRRRLRDAGMQDGGSRMSSPASFFTVLVAVLVVVALALAFAFIFLA